MWTINVTFIVQVCIPIIILITVCLCIAMQVITKCVGDRRLEMLTCSTAWAALSIGNSSISTGDQGAGDLATHSSRVLQKHRDQIHF